jgi:hypothetical protein
MLSPASRLLQGQTSRARDSGDGGAGFFNVRQRNAHNEANVWMTATRKGLVSTLSSLMAKAQQTTINIGLISRGPTRTAARAPN